jgi:outer membrane protein TolC
MTLHGQLQRNYMITKDNTRWKLDASANLSTGNGIGKGQNSGINSVFNGFNYKENIGVTLIIPIDDQQAKQAVLSAKIAIQEAELALKQEKWSIETNAINTWNNVMSAKKALVFAEDAEKLQEKTYQISYQKYLHGLIDSLQLQSALQSLTQSKQTSLNAKINCIKSLVNLDMVIGHTLKTWQIQVRI